MGKIGFPIVASVGTDGYSYYTGLLRKTQRLIDGYAPDYNSFPGIKAVGASIETLPPLLQRISLALDITTTFGVNITDIQDVIKSTITNYVNRTLGVGDDVILSQVLVVVMGVRGVAAARIISPNSVTVERISISQNEKAYIDSSDISIN